MVELPVDPKSNNVEASIDLKPNIVEISVDLKPNVYSKENIVKSNVYKLVESKVDIVGSLCDDTNVSRGEIDIFTK